MVLTAGIEAGGTSFVVSIADNSADNVVNRARFPTTSDPVKTMQQCINWIKQNNENPAAIGIAAFGPICLKKTSPNYGRIEKTPKEGWTHFELLKYMKTAFPDIPIGIDTDVNGAAIAELVHGVGKGSDMSSLVYVTIGTGIGVGILVNGVALIGMSHAEAGHIRVQRRKDDTFEGVCPFHNDCVEGLASAAAISARCQIHESKLVDVDDSHSVWDIIGFYLGQLCANLFLILSPECIVLGGGVSKRQIILPAVRKYFSEMIAGYVDYPESLIQLSQLDVGAGVIGSHLLAYQELQDLSQRPTIKSAKYL